MPFELWGATGTYGLVVPDNLPGYLLLFVYSLLLAYFLYRFYLGFYRLSSRQWLVIIGLSFLSFFVSQLFPLFVSQNPEFTLTLFAAFPYLLAGAIFNPAVALITGLFSGLGRSLGQSHTLFDIYHFAFAAVLAAMLMRQNYLGRFFSLIRFPIISGALANASIVILKLLANLVSGSVGDGYIKTLDQSLYATSADFLSLFVEGAVGGTIVFLLLIGLPHLRPKMTLVLPPKELSLRNRLLNNFMLFAISLTILLVAVVFILSINVSTRLVVNQMVHNAKTVSAEIPDFQSHLQNLLAQYDDTESLLDSDVEINREALARLHRTDPFYRRILLVDQDQTVTAAYPPEDVGLVSLSNLEKEAVAETFLTSVPEVATTGSSNSEQVVSFIVPVVDPEGATAAVLIGRVPQLSLESLIVGLQGTVGQGIGFIVDENSRIIAHSDSNYLLQEWNLPSTGVDVIGDSQVEPGMAYLGPAEGSEGRELIYYLSIEDQPWKVVTTVPYTVVLNLALSIGGPLALVLIIVMAAFYINLTRMGNDIATPISELVDAAKTIAAGGEWNPSSRFRRSDEIGQLRQAFNQMYRSRNKRLRELSLLLDVSHKVASNIDINQGIPAILRGALRGTGAVGARAVVLNPSGSYPLTYGEGPISDDMAVLDRLIMTKLRYSEELILATPVQIRSALDLAEDEELPVPALIAIPLHFQERFQGVIWFGYRQPHSFDPTARTLLRTLAGQAAVLVENARLFAMAEGGRRRLAAVLASTTDAFIVTDQTDRVLLVNRAMERAFNIKANEVVSRPIVDVIEINLLVKALSGKDERIRNLEIHNDEGKIFYCSAAPIINNDGQALGRVAVLHDITQLKEIDQMKSDFVSTVSHDLRSPLTFMRGYATMLPMVGDINEKQGEYVDKILKGIEQMTQLVVDLLDLGRIEAGVELREEDIELEPLLSEIATEYWQHAHMNGIKLQVDIQPELPCIKGDTALIRQAVTNLVTNGIKYAPNSGEMTLKAEALNGEMIISVRDNGPGIPKQEQMRLFEKFFRVKERGTEKVKGAGLGLAIVKSITERHGGRAWCDSQYGQGSTFSILLPIGGNKKEKPSQ